MLELQGFSGFQEAECTPKYTNCTPKILAKMAGMENDNSKMKVPYKRGYLRFFMLFYSYRFRTSSNFFAISFLMCSGPVMVT